MSTGNIESKGIIEPSVKDKFLAKGWTVKESKGKNNG